MATKPMNKILVIAILGLMLISFVSAYYCIIQQDNFKEIKIIPISIGEKDFDDLYKIECDNKEFYTTYPDRLNSEKVCK